MAFGDVVQSNSGTGTTATVAPTLPGATTAGNIVVLTFAADDYNGSPNAGWTQSSEMEQQTFHGGYLWWLTATAGMTIPSYTVGSAVRSAWTLVEYEGPFDASPYDASEGQFQQTSSNVYTTASMTPTAGDRLMVAGIQGGHATGEILGTWGSYLNSFTEVTQITYNGGNPRLILTQLRLVVTANGSTAYSTGATISGLAGQTQARSACIIAFKAGAGGGTTYNDTTAETASSADTPGGLLVIAAAVGESATLTDTVVGSGPVTAYDVAVLETAAASETLAAAVVGAAPVPLPPPAANLDAVMATYFPGIVVQQNLTDAVAAWLMAHGEVTDEDVPAILARANVLLAAEPVPPVLYPTTWPPYPPALPPYPTGLPRFPDSNPATDGWSIAADDMVVRGPGP